MAVRKPAAKTAQQLVAKNYRLLKYQPLTFTLKVGRDNTLLIFDKKTNQQRAIRHCPGERSIFVDEQSKDSVVQPIVFLKGLLETKATDVTTQLFLDSHPKNGQVFQVIDEAADAITLTDTEELKLDVKQAIRDKSKEDSGIEEIRIVVSVLISDEKAAAKMSIPELKNALYDLVEVNVNRFVNDEGDVTIFDDPDIKRQAITQHSFNSGVIQVSADGGKVMWSDNKSTICHIPVGQNHIEFFAKFLSTEKGIQVASEIAKR